MSERPLIFIDPYPRNQEMIFSEATERVLRDLGRLVIHFGSRAPDDLVERILPEIQVIIGQTAMPRERLDRAPKLRAILNVKANWEPNIDYEEARARGIHVLSAAPAMAPAVAEFCLGQAITLARGLQHADPLFRMAQEAYGIGGNAKAYSLYDSKVGLLGYGNLGKSLVPLLRPFQPEILVYDPWLSSGYLSKEGLIPVSLEEILAKSKFLFLLAGVTTENEGFLGKALLEFIPTDATVVLASRAEIVDFEAFIELAGQGRFRAAIDVFPEEPVSKDDLVRKTSHVLFSSHLAGGIRDSYARIQEMMLDDIKQILQGLPPLRMQRAEPNLAAKMRSR
ncbi:MAG TPA: hydroxyacid dehydrogenase [Deltaproteobacteria bacterium]|nr:hydroxyacid dehydrogenase [Deltaproteobacteria bacterium]|tara:strand:- start:1574 stop:2587 length:1014 start_codon:yes stop_codon:yes gene_type:complete